MRTKEVAKHFGITVQTLRYWERSGLLSPVPKDSNGYRDYDDDNLEQVKFVVCMRATGMSIAALKKYMMLFAVGPSTIDERKSLLANQVKSIDAQMESLRSAKKLLTYKIEHYEELFGK
ncbi:MerR family transcriptional regulator [Nicoliella lavandulae]|uniref:MerR family transcriptional regulator n=1 Tax=Nicoliella lavandulae TaxID=3082954 RepID=A0ABU8SJ79_9LACO